MSQSVELTAQEWQQVISALAMTNPVLVKISSQLQQQQAQQEMRRQVPTHSGNSSIMKEPDHGL